jgi:hypothetical protein
VHKRPRWISPYHYRLDWQLWIAAICRTPDRSPWIFKFLLKLLQQDETILGLTAGDPWANEADHIKPRYVRIDRYRYKFHKAAQDEKDPPYWDRELLGRVYPRQGIASVDTLKEEIKRR